VANAEFCQWWDVAIDRNTLLREVESLLAYHKSIGICDYPRNRDIDNFCEKRSQNSSSSARAESENCALTGTETGAGRVRRKRKIKDEGGLSDLRLEIASCTGCDLHKQRIFPVPGKGAGNARLLVIGDWLSCDTPTTLQEGTIMGIEQDRMLGKMLDAIKMAPEEVFITNVIKCAVPATCNPTAVHVHSCLSFLRRQIALLVPELICTMGMIAARAVLGQSRSLSQLRGKLHSYESEDGLRIPVITTYHPTYLLQNPEMKRATWADLQFLAKKM